MSLNRKQFDPMSDDFSTPVQRDEQLPMFMSAREIKSKYRPLEGDHHEVWNEGGASRIETDDEMWDRKLDEAHDSGHAQHILEHGVHRPVHLQPATSFKHWSGRQMDEQPAEIIGGHHRIAVMADEAPDELIPVLHHTSLYGARTATNKAYPYT